MRTQRGVEHWAQSTDRKGEGEWHAHMRETERKIERVERAREREIERESRRQRERVGESRRE